MSTYATHAISRHLWRVVRRERRIAIPVPERTAEPAVEHADPEWLDIQPSELVAELLEELPPTQRRMLELRFGLADGGPE